MANQNGNNSLMLQGARPHGAWQMCAPLPMQ
jgi:hypothetical protein